MADQEHLARLKRSVEEWNQWRTHHPEILPLLSGANLRKANLSEVHLSFADLSFADLREADLSFADLSGANLREANLNGADLYEAKLIEAQLNGAILTSTVLHGANLSGAFLNGANLREAVLNGAGLREANLSGADLSGADLFGANLTQTQFGHTVFAKVDLNSVRGLETAIHHGPSTVDINSVTLPIEDHIRRHFLRNAGFSETVIDYLPSLLTPAIYPSLFISYSSNDHSFAKKLHADLQNQSVRCWFAPHDLRPGTPILRGIEEAIGYRDTLLLILSEHAVKSRWIEREVDAALHQEIKRGQDVLFPIRLDHSVLHSDAGWATRLHHRHIGDFTNWHDETIYQQAFTHLLRHLKQKQKK